MGLTEIARQVILGASDGEKALTLPSSADNPGPVLYGAGGSTRRRLSGAAQGRHLKAYAGGDDAIDWVMDCASLAADTVSSAPYHFERDGTELVVNLTDKYPKGTEQAPRDLVNLLQQPNPYLLWSELIALTVIDYLIAGNAYWLKWRPSISEGKPVGLFRLCPDYVDIETNDAGAIANYIYKVPGGEPTDIPADQVLHFRRPNPHSQHFGAGIIAGAPRMYDLELYLTESMTGYYERGTRLSGIITSDKNVPDSLFQKIKRTWAALYGGRDNSHQVAVLERGLQWQSVQSSAVEAEYAQIATFSRDRICQAFRTPPALLGASEQRSNPLATVQAQRIYDTKVIRPFLNKLQEAISFGLTQAWGLDFVFEFEYLPPKEDQITTAGVIATLPGVTIREVREAAGYEPLGTPQDDIVLNLPGDNTNASGVKDRGLPGEAGRPPDPANTAAVPADGNLPADASASQSAKQVAAKKGVSFGG